MSIGDKMNEHKASFSSLLTDKDYFQKALREESQGVKLGMLDELTKVEEDMKKHFANQKAENQKLQQQITILKNDKTQLQNQIIGILRLFIKSISKKISRFGNASRK
jgi:hypothetical protein